jgi:hypothetical protein
MILSQHIVDLIIESIPLRQKLGLALTFTDEWVKQRARQNKPNGPLTTYQAIQIISEETKMDVNEILVNEKPVPQLSK